jgi:hypothetical protein
VSKRAIGFSVSGMFVEETSRPSILTSARAFTRTTLPGQRAQQLACCDTEATDHDYARAIGGGPNGGSFASVSAPGPRCETQTGGDETGLTHQNNVLKIMPLA